MIMCHIDKQLKKKAMKTKFWVLTTLALFIVTVGFATETPKLNIVANDEEKVLVSFESVTPCPVELIITDKDGMIMHYWQSRSPTKEVNQLLNLRQMGKGNFNVTLSYGGKSINREISITPKEIKIGPSVQLIEPCFCYKNESLNVSFLNAANKNVYLNVYKDGTYYNGFSLGKDFNIQKSMDFSMTEKGNYEIVLSDFFKEHFYKVTK